MHNSSKIFPFLIFFGLVLAVLWGVYENSVHNSLTSVQQCQLDDDVCVFNADQFDLSIKFKQAPMIEEELLIDFSLTNDFIISKSWIEGANMYMGKTPVITKSTSENNIEGVTFLGSCSEPRMNWRLFVEVKSNKAEQTFIYSALFTTEH